MKSLKVLVFMGLTYLLITYIVSPKVYRFTML